MEGVVINESGSLLRGYSICCSSFSGTQPGVRNQRHGAGIEQKGLSLSPPSYLFKCILFKKLKIKKEYPMPSGLKLSINSNNLVTKPLNLGWNK